MSDTGGHVGPDTADSHLAHFPPSPAPEPPVTFFA